MKTDSNYIFRTLSAIFLLIALSTGMNAQEYISTPVEISKEKIRIDGKICYSHVVQERQTLFSISKAYGVTIEDIWKYNPGIKENGLKKNSIIIIPTTETQKPEKEKNTSVEKEAIPEPTPAPAQTVQVSKQIKKKAQEPKQKRSRRLHTVKWYEDLDVIASHYGVSVEEIMAANKLTGRKLSRRQKLIIPYPGEIEISPAVTEESSQISTESPKSEISEPENISDTVAVSFMPKSKVDATIIMPLTNAEGEPNRNNMDFYCGALLAIYDLAENGLDCNLNVYDIMDSKTHFNIETITESDVVIGPVSSGDLTRLFNSVSEAKAIVSPLDPRTEKLSDVHTELIQAPTPHSAQYKDLVKWMEEDYTEGDKVMMITEKGARLGGIAAEIREALDSSSLIYNPFSYSILEGRDVTQPLTELMTTEGANRIIIASESEAFVNDVVRNLNLLIYNNLDIVLYAPSRIRSFETIEVENFHNTSMHVSLGYYIDYESDEVKDFLKKYRALYNTEPTQFAFQGYDITRYFLELIARYGDNWKLKISESPEKMMQSTFSFVQKPSGAFINNGIRRIVYDKGYQLRQVK